MRLDAWLKRCFPVVVMLLLGVAAYFQASGLSYVLGNLVGPRTAHAAQLPVSKLRAPAREERPSAEAILARNPFDSTYVREAPPAPGPEEMVTPGPDWYADPPCDKARVVLIASSDDPAWSFAALAGPDGVAMLRRRGDEIAGYKVAYVGDRREVRDGLGGKDGAAGDRVWLTSSNGARCQAVLGGKIAKGAAPAAPKEKDKGSDLLSKIRKTGDRQYEVDRTAIESLIANPAELMKVRAVPEKDGDRVVGLKLHGIPKGSVLDAIGLMSGDRLTSINGYEMTDPHSMLDAYTKLMTADHVVASIVRGGKPTSIDLAVK
jgi:general secretion pathway protein C